MLNICFPRPNLRLADARRDPVCSANLHSARVRAKRASAGREQFGGALRARCDLVLYKHEEQKVSVSLDLCTREIKGSLSSL